jgi:hypothetical protein
MNSNGTHVDSHYYKSVGIEPGTVPVDLSSVLSLLADDL